MKDDKYFYQPVFPFIVTQKFGQNLACVNMDNKVISCDGTNPPPGYKSLYGPKGHLGVDLSITHGQEVYCCQKGMVSFIDTNPKSGLDVRVLSVIKGVEYKHIYEHLMGYQPKVGDILETGQLIGWCDNTGYSAGDHLHWQVEQNINNVWIPIDPLPLMAPIFAKTILGLQLRIKEFMAFIADNFANWLRK